MNIFGSRAPYFLLIMMVILTAQISSRYIVVEDPDGDAISVITDGGIRKLATLSTVTVEEVFGKDPQGSTFFYFGASLEDASGIGAADDTVRVQIPAAPSPLDTVYPAVDVTYTVTAADVASDNPERSVALGVCDALESDSNFNTSEWTCQVAKDFAYVHIVNDMYNEFGTRPSYTLTCSGTTVCNYGETDIIRRGKETELSRSPNDPARLGVLAISGSVSVTPGAISDQFQSHAQNNNSYDMAIDGSVTPVDFRVDCDPDGYEKWITSMRFWVADNGIKFGQFLAINGALANGIYIEIRSGNTVRVFLAETIKSTEDFQAHFSSPINLFSNHVQAGRDLIVAEANIPNPFVLEPCGTYDIDDYILVRIQDNISTILDMEFIVFGFRQEP